VAGTAGEFLGIGLQWTREKMPECFTLVNGFLTDCEKVEI
jgi:hypothetical protein